MKIVVTKKEKQFVEDTFEMSKDTSPLPNNKMVKITEDFDTYTIDINSEYIFDVVRTAAKYINILKPMYLTLKNVAEGFVKDCKRISDKYKEETLIKNQYNIEVMLDASHNFIVVDNIIQIYYMDDELIVYNNNNKIRKSYPHFKQIDMTDPREIHQLLIDLLIIPSDCKRVHFSYKDHYKGNNVNPLIEGKELKARIYSNELRIDNYNIVIANERLSVYKIDPVLSCSKPIATFHIQLENFNNMPYGKITEILKSLNIISKNTFVNYSKMYTH